MSVHIYVEGGGDNKDTLRRCREGFSRYCQKLVAPNKRPRVVACGGRTQAFDRFQTAARNAARDEVCVLLVDAEAGVSAQSAVEHLIAKEHWDFSGMDQPHVFLMVQAMEAWLLADRGALSAFYDGGFVPNSLPGNTNNIEQIRKDDLEPALKKATKHTRTKGEYHKTRHAIELLGMIDPGRVEAVSPHAVAFHRFLRSL